MDNSKRKSSNGSQAKRPGRTDKKNNKKHQENGLKGSKAREIQSKVSLQSDPGTLANDSPLSTGNPEVNEYMEIHYVDDAHGGPKTRETVADQYKDGIDGNSSNMDKESNKAKEEESDIDTLKDSSSSQDDSLTADEEKLERASMEAPKRISRISEESSPNGLGKELDLGKKVDKEKIKLHSKALQYTHQKSENSARESPEFTQPDSSTKSMEVPPEPSSESSDGVDDKPTGYVKEIDVLNKTSNVAQIFGSDEETFDAAENGECKDKAALEQKFEQMEMRIEKLEEELREVAALEISLYSVVAEHGSSVHKVHTPARRLSRLYIHACKYWTLNKRATVAKNTVSGLVLISRSCSNDVSRLTFWLSNTVVLREIISQAFGSSHNSSPFSKFLEANGDSKKSEVKATTLKWKGSSSTKQNNGFVLSLDNWQETGTFIGALEKVESWIFSRIVESIWWQAFTPHMQTPDADACANKVTGRLLGPFLGDQQQGSFSINLWKSAFQDAFSRLCPIRAAGHECGCLPVLAKMVMEHCISRLDVAMFNAILRESAHEIPTDPVSDPIVDSKVLPIPAGDLSFGSGAQLKNSVGNWFRWLTDAFGNSDDFVAQEDNHGDEDEHRQGGDSEPKTFILLNELSDLLMLPKDMIMDQSIRNEACPSIGLPLIKRILCNFTPDEFCLDPVPGAVLEALNAESIVERRLSGDTLKSFPYTAAAVVYNPPSTANVGEKVAEAGGKSQLSRNVSMAQRKGYTSDEELEDLDSPLASIIDKVQFSPTIKSNGVGNGHSTMSARYELLREVWSL